MDNIFDIFEKKGKFIKPYRTFLTNVLKYNNIFKTCSTQYFILLRYRSIIYIYILYHSILFRITRDKK